MTLILKLDLDMVKMYLYTNNEVSMWRGSEVKAWTDIHTDGQTDSHTHRETDRQIDRHTDRQTHNHDWKHYLPTYVGGKKEKVHLSTYDTNVIQLGNTNNKMATPAPVQLQLQLTVSGLVFLCICLWLICTSAKLCEPTFSILLRFSAKTTSLSNLPG